MSRLCDGLIGKTLLFMEIPKETMSPDGILGLERLSSIVSGNLKNRVELEGRGPWLHEYPLQFDYYDG